MTWRLEHEGDHRFLLNPPYEMVVSLPDTVTAEIGPGERLVLVWPGGLVQTVMFRNGRTANPSRLRFGLVGNPPPGMMITPMNHDVLAQR